MPYIIEIIKKEKPAFIRFEVIKIKILEKDKDKRIKLFIKKSLYGK